jgi:hypothetical protein
MRVNQIDRFLALDAVHKTLDRRVMHTRFVGAENSRCHVKRPRVMHEIVRLAMCTGDIPKPGALLSMDQWRQSRDWHHHDRAECDPSADWSN